MVDVAGSLEVIKRGAEELLVEADFVEKLRRGRPSGSRRASIPRPPTCILGIPY